MRASQPSLVDDTPFYSGPALVARLHEYAAIAGEQLGARSAQILGAVARGNRRMFEAEVTRLAARFVDRLEQNWD